MKSTVLRSRLGGSSRSGSQSASLFEDDDETTRVIKQPSSDEEVGLLLIQQEAAASAGDIRFRTKCTDDIVPDVARNVTWKDPFYENDTDVIAAFDINYVTIQQDAAEGLLSVLFTCVVAGIFASIFEMCLAFLLVGPFWVTTAVSTIREFHLMKRLHVAITCRGVYLDEVDVEPPVGRFHIAAHLMRREVLAFDAITSCHVEVAGNFRPAYRVILMLANNEKRTVSGLVGTQDFVDVFLATKERARLLAAVDAQVLNVEEAAVAEIISSDPSSHASDLHVFSRPPSLK